MSTEKFNMVLKLYPIEIQKSAKRREIWYHISEGKKLPKYLQKPDYLHYTVDKDGWIIKLETGEKLVRNYKTAGKPNMKRINGQSIWDGDVSRYERNDLKKFLSDYFIPNINRQLPEHLFTAKYIHVEFIFYVVEAEQDIDNHGYPYIKAFMDALQTSERIVNDSPVYIRGYYCRYVVVKDDRRLEIKIHFCENSQRIE